MINAIVIIVTSFAFACVLMWILRPSFRKWVEAPKYTMLEKEAQFRKRLHGDHEA